MPSIQAYVDDFDTLTVVIDRKFFNGESSDFYVLNEKEEILPCIIKEKTEQEQSVIYFLQLDTPFVLGKKYFLREFHGQMVPLIYRFITHREKFQELFTYDKEDLGSVYHKEYTDFAVWAPTAISVTLKIYGQENVFYSLKRGEKGVFRTRVYGDLSEKEYTYLVERNGKTIETIDIYALSSNQNGQHSVVIDPSRIISIKDHSALPALNSYVDAILYECNIRDISSNKESGIKNRGKFLGAIEENTRYKDVPTGIDYISSLGITHIQLQPVLDYATVDECHEFQNYNWGYDPSQFISLEGSYSSNPKDAYSRMLEFKKLVVKYHERGIRVNLDIVYNHMYDSTNNPLENTVPYYYFRYDERGVLSNGSFCGNDIESRRPMVRHVFEQALKTLIHLYNVDGFRFDLMGILDVDTMNALATALNKEKKVMLYGEGWDLPTALSSEEKARIYNQYKMPLIAHFNDTFRDVVRGGNADYSLSSKGYITGDTSKAFEMCSVLSANTLGEPYFLRFDSPAKSINAVETHDNLTCWDKMHFCSKEETNLMRRKRQCLMIASTLLAQGIPFLHAGIEFCDTKKNIKDSYNAKDEINGMQYDRTIKYSDVVLFTKKMIALRKKYSAFRLKTKEEIEQKVQFKILESGALIYDIKEELYTMRVIMNPSFETFYESFEDNWEIIFDEKESASGKKVSEIEIKECSLTILKKERKKYENE